MRINFFFFPPTVIKIGYKIYSDKIILSVVNCQLSKLDFNNFTVLILLNFFKIKNQTLK